MNNTYTMYSKDINEWIQVHNNAWNKDINSLELLDALKLLEYQSYIVAGLGDNTKGAAVSLYNINTDQ